MLAMQTAGHAAPLTLATKPLFISTSVAPNLVVALDDSGSMAWSYVPDSLAGTAGTRRFLSAYYNPQTYNPEILYQLPVKADGSTYTTSFTTAYLNGFDTTRGNINLSTSYRPITGYTPDETTQSYANNPNDFGTTSTARTRANPAYYYVRNNSLPSCSASNDADEDCYSRVFVTATSGTGPSGVDERQNFAIWYSFYRTRNLTVVSGATLALKNLDPAVRVAWTSLNTCKTFGTACAGWNGTNTDNRIRAFSGTHKSNFYNWVARLPAENGTPLRGGLTRIGEYYKTSGVNSPYAQDPQVSAGTESTCRQNYSMVMTDGIWNTDSISIGNIDNTTTTLPDGTIYTGRAPYRDGNSSSLADIAFRYWATDLRPDLANNLTPYSVDTSGTATEQYFNPKNDPAKWQHMVTFMIGLGLTTNLDLVNLDWQGNTYTGDFNNLESGAKTWPATGNDQTGNVADLWHAAINARGQFFSADRPTDILNAFKAVVSRVNSGVGASGSVAANTTSIRNGTNIYQARFNSGDWSGDLLSIPLNLDGTLPADLLTASAWRATDTVTATNPSTRVVLTNKASTNKGIAFKWPTTPSSPTTSELDAAQTTLLSTNPDTFVTDTLGDDRLSYLRGDRTKEGVTFRNRNSLLGDIINASPILVEPPAAISTDPTYKTFRAARATRPTIVYVGANDGMLHGLKVTDGTEVLAYVPNAVFSKLNQLTASSYSHQFYNDGSIADADVKFSDNTWHTMLVSGMGNGGRGIYALDVTDPTAFTEANAANIAKFEYTNLQDSDVGYIQGTPTIIKMNNGKYAAVFGNGYNSTGTGQSTLFIVDIQTGALIKKISTGVGTVATPNALASPVVIDEDGNGTADFAYAGDLQGNMWKFDLTNAAPANWKVGFTGLPLFSTGKPITEQPDATPNPNGGYMVYFGTGKYIEALDSNDISANNFYGLWDNGVAPITALTQLQAQSVVSTSVLNGNPYRSLSANPVDYSTKRGWYLPLPATGERSITDPLVRGGKIIFTTTIPTSAGCSFGGTSWLMELDYLTGGKTTAALFDTNDDGKVDTSDAIVNGLGLSAISSSPTLLQGLGMQNSPLDRIYLNQSNGLINSTLQAGSRLTSRRTSWTPIIKK